jgi:hypothetical protein
MFATQAALATTHRYMMGAYHAALRAGANTLNDVTLTGVLSYLVNFVNILGGVLLAWGAIGIGMAIKDGQGMSMDTNVGKVIGGAIIIGAAQAFNTLAAQAK